MSVPRAAAVNVDIDSLVHYHRINGLPEAAATDAAWERGVPRFAELFAELDVKATFFVVAQDLDRSAPACAMVSQLARDGHEIASHSWSHPYDLTRWTPEALAGELDRARVLLEEVAGRPIVGFRSPGYTLTEGLLGLLRDRGYAYDSSLFPCPPYYLAKAAVMARMRLGGRVCQAILGDPRDAFTRRLLPHHRQGLLELPITVLPGLRVPIIGTSLFMLGARGYRLALRRWRRRRRLLETPAPWPRGRS